MPALASDYSSREDAAVGQDLDYAFPHAAKDEARRLELFQQHLDPLTRRRIERLGIRPDAAVLEIGGGRGSISRWLAQSVAPAGRVTATDLQIDFLQALEVPNLDVVRHDIRSDTFATESFDLIHARAVLMHVPVDVPLLGRIISWLRPGGWLVLEDPDFGLWMSDADPLWAKHPGSWHAAFPNGSLSRGRWLLREVPRLGLTDVGADGEVDVIEPGTALAEFYQLSMAAIAPAAVAAAALSGEEAAALVARPNEPAFLGCGFVHIGVWGRRP